MFEDRSSAGTQLAAELTRRGIDADVVLGIPRGALPVARPVADALEAALDVVVARKLGAPGNPELALGAVGSGGGLWRNEALIEQLGVSQDYLEEVRRDEETNAREKEARYRRGERVEIEGKRVVVVDDGVATGATAIACLRQVRDWGATTVILAVPVGSPSSLERLEVEADEVISLLAPTAFRAVGQFYQRFDQVSDEEALEYLDP